MTITRETRTVPGLESNVTLSIDQWGIAHIRASSKRDLFFAQGYNAARDRLWQIDLWRKRGLGLLAKDFGPGYIEQDRAARLFLYQGSMEEEWASYSEDARDIAEAFISGINAYISEISDGRRELPAEFRILGTVPQEWMAEDVVRIRSHSMMRNAHSEIVRANVISRTSPAVDALRQELVPPPGSFDSSGLDLADIPLDVLDVFNLALAPARFDEERLKAPLEDASKWARVSATGDVLRDASTQGSNNWVIHGDRTATGRPILANDPHRTHAVPSLRYIVHLTCPEFDVIGAGEPCLPGISIGHNGYSAFGLTLFYGHDQEDVYVYETSPDDEFLYKYGESWERMDVREEVFAVKGSGDVTLPLRFTRHGPVIFSDQNKHRAFAIRTVWSEPGSAPYFASIASMRAQNFDDFRTAMARWGVPATNQVYADKSGRIGWVVAGFSPVRPNWTGLLPVSGDGSFEWDGFLAATALPHDVNPSCGFIATANEHNLPEDWDYKARQIGYEWLDSSRADRIREVLSGSRRHTVVSSCQLQVDTTSLVARRLTGILGDIDSTSPSYRQAGEVFAEWDHRLDAESGAALLFETWWTSHLVPAVFAAATSDRFVQSLLQPGDPASIVALLEQPDARLGSDPRAARDRLIVQTLEAAFAYCETRFGSYSGAWQWGAVHQVHFVHALSRAARKAGLQDTDIGPLPVGGSDSSPMNASYRAEDFRVTVGASVRLVIDVGDWDASVCINTPGQSGTFGSPHYADMADTWARGNYVPLLYTGERVDAATAYELNLQPAVPSTESVGRRDAR